MLSVRDARQGCLCKRNPFIILCILVLVSVVSSVPARGTEETCTTPRRKTGTCISIKECPELQSILAKRPVSEVNRLYLTESQCGQVGRHPKVCCAKKEEAKRAVQETREEDFDFSKKNKNIPSQKFCGDVTEEKILGGNATNLEDYPWMALLGYRRKGKGGLSYDFRCGGALVSSRYVLTAAHCISKIDSDLELKIVRLGEWDLGLEEDCVKGGCSDAPKDINVSPSDFIVHEKYEPNSLHQRHDIALIRLPVEVTTTLFIGPICLPLIDEKISKKTHFGENLIISGWGKTEDGKSSKVKQQVQVPMVDQEECIDFWKQSRIIVADSQFCAGGREGKDSCKGDSGGPIFIKEQIGNQLNWFIRGIISAGVRECGNEDAFSLYTDVSKYNSWLWKNIKA